MTAAERKRLTVLLSLLGVALLVLVYRALPHGGAAGSSASGKALEFTLQRVPVLSMEVLTPEPTPTGGIGRNPFAFGPKPTPTPAPPRPTLPPRPTRPPQPTPTPRLIHTADGKTLPPPPPFRGTFIGYFGPPERMVAVFRDGKKLKVQVEGGVLDEKFIIRHVDFQSVEIGFVGYPEEVTTRVPLEKK